MPELRKLREIMDEVYRLYDRRCRTQTALEKPRLRVKRFKHLSKLLKKPKSPTVDRSLIFLDDKQLPSTSNAVERGNRRFRKIQKMVYRVRTLNHIKHRIVLDMFHDLHSRRDRQTIQSLHNERSL